MNNKIKLQELLREMVNEEKVNGLDVTQKAQKESKKFNDEYEKEVSSKMKDYEEPVMPKEDEEIDEFNKPGNIEGDDKTYHDEVEIRNGQEMIDYDNEPDQRFKDRQEMALAGDSLMGNKTYEGEWNPETGEGNGNTEEVWGSSGGKNTGEEIVKQAKASMKKREDAEEKLNSPVTSVSRRDLDDTKINENKNTMKRLRFKKPFDGVGNALNLIPENYKVDSKEFQMTDGNESYTIRWEGSLDEGSAVVLQAADQTMINEDMEKMKHLMGFKSEDTLGNIKGNDRINEDDSFREIWDKTKNILNETEGATGVAGFGFVAEEEVNEEENVNEEDVNEEAKPDYIDIDGDGDEEESMKDAAKDAEVNEAEEVSEEEK